MKITIEPTERSVPPYGDNPPYRPKIELTLPVDDVLLSEVIQNIRSALIAWGYAPESVKEYINED